ncbi:hypothetical protein AMJ85_10900 [candidate division BRC1 bacterium SM23_51]|nr:MAG: hypothetical protein AMJ85_10900 [candidate division BRC1 bacterium SM23_51]
MKKLFLVIGVLFVAFLIYVQVTDRPTPSASTPVSSRPTTLLTPVPPPAPPAGQPNVFQRTQQAVDQSNTAPARQPTVDKRSAEVRQIIYGCAKRARWTITAYQQTAYGASRVTGRAINDNVAVQQFLSEIERSGILVDIVTGPKRAFMGRDQRPYLEATFIIKWR